MKKFAIIATALLFGLVSCTKFESESPLPVESATDPSITISDVTDDSFTATITAVSGTGFYSYAIIPGAAKEVNPTTLLKVGAKGAFEGTNDFAKTPSVTVEASDLEFNSTYTVYAVAASVQGTVGNVITKEVNTSDGVAPKVTGATAQDSVITMTLSEAVEKSRILNVSADYYAVNSPEFKAEGTPEGKADVDVEVEGKTATLTVKGLPAGAYYAINFPEGTFSDLTGNKLPEMSSSVYFDEKGKLATKGITARMPVQSFDLALADTTIQVIVDAAEPIVLVWPEDVVVVDADDEAEGKIVYDNATASHTYKTYYGADFGVAEDLSSAVVIPNASEDRPDPVRGDDVTITVPSFLIDIYGNTNNELVIGPKLYSYGYTFDDVVGTYVNSGKSIYTGYDEDPFEMVIAKSDDAKKGNVMLTKYCGVDSKIYADFDFDAGTLTMPLFFEVFNVLDLGDSFALFCTYGYFSCEEGMENDLVLYMTESGKFTDGNDYPGYYYEIYSKPASGKFEDIPDDAKPIGGDYNCFFPFFSKATPAPSTVVPMSTKEFKTLPKTGFERVRR